MSSPVARQASPFRRPALRLALFGLGAVAALYFGFLHFPVPVALNLVRQAGYYVILLTFVLWLATLWRLRVVPAQRHAAASGETAVPQTAVNLGQLGTLDATARLLCTARTVTLRVFGGPSGVARVEFGAGGASAADEHGAWTVEIPVADGPVALRVVAPSGEQFETTIELSPSEPDADR